MVKTILCFFWNRRHHNFESAVSESFRRCGRRNFQHLKRLTYWDKKTKLTNSRLGLDLDHGLQS